jgi:indole-3-glycerol phosphate synthase
MSEKNFLSEIIALKRARLEAAKRAKSFGAIQDEARRVRERAQRNALRSALSNAKRINIIAEIKRASPSKGEINAGVDVAKQAKLYAAGGARAVSVLTEEDRFRGSLKDLCEVKSAISIPVLRKDFIFDEYQVYESAAAGADALLLIFAALDEAKLARLRHLTEYELGMDALVEVHTHEEFRRALASGANIIGINNRDLRSFEVRLETSIEILSSLSGYERWHDCPDTLFVSESGINTSEDIKRLRACGFDAFLIGESLMRAGDAASILKELSGEEILAADERG